MIKISAVEKISAEALRIIGEIGEISCWEGKYFFKVKGEENGSKIFLLCGCKIRYNRDHSRIFLISACANHGSANHSLIFFILNSPNTPSPHTKY